MESSKLKAINGIKIYPSPVSIGSMLNISFENMSSSELFYSIQIMDLSGRIVHADNGIAQHGNNEVLLDTSAFVPSTYILRLTHNRGSLVKKVVFALNR